MQNLHGETVMYSFIVYRYNIIKNKLSNIIWSVAEQIIVCIKVLINSYYLRSLQTLRRS